MEMPIDIFQQYQKSMGKIMSREALQKIEISSYPHMKKKEDRDKVRKRYSKNINSDSPVTGLEMARKLSEWQTKK